MGRDHTSSRNQFQMRQRIAHLAARVMVEDGIDDYALAKRKAARQAGVSETRSLPTNDEIDEAIRLHHELYRDTEQRDRLRDLRVSALAAMREFERFAPRLSGPVLTGLAGKYTGITLHLFPENAKDVEIFLINRGVPFDPADTRYFMGREARSLSAYQTETRPPHGDDLRLVLFERNDLRQVTRATQDGRPLERATAEEVEQLVR